MILDLSQDYWEYTLAEEARYVFTNAVLKGFLMPMRIPQGVLNNAAYFRAMVQRKLEMLNGMI